MWYKFLLSCLMIANCTAKRWNFLLIIVDDLRPALGCYGDKKAETPNVDQLAESGTTFTRAYAQQALCAPSRNSFLTSRRPDTLRTYDFYHYWRDMVGNFTTLPQHLRENGYTTISLGKVFHPGISSNHSDDLPYSWTEKPFHPYTNKYKDAPVCGMGFKNLVCPVEVAAMPNGTLPDLEILQEAIYFLRNQKLKLTPFFLAVGFQKPHIPLKYPEEYLRAAVAVAVAVVVAVARQWSVAGGQCLEYFYSVHTCVVTTLQCLWKRHSRISGSKVPFRSILFLIHYSIM